MPTTGTVSQDSSASAAETNPPATPPPPTDNEGNIPVPPSEESSVPPMDAPSTSVHSEPEDTSAAPTAEDILSGSVPSGSNDTIEGPSEVPMQPSEDSVPLETVPQDNVGLVSSTTVDRDQTEIEINPEIQPVQSTSSDSIDGLNKENNRGDNDEDPVSRPSNSFHSSSFQSAFAAFAGVVEPEPEASSTEPGEDTSGEVTGIEAHVSSAIDSGQVTTSGEFNSVTDPQTTLGDETTDLMTQQAMEVDKTAQSLEEQNVDSDVMQMSEDQTTKSPSEAMDVSVPEESIDQSETLSGTNGNKSRAISSVDLTSGILPAGVTPPPQVNQETPQTAEDQIPPDQLTSQPEVSSEAGQEATTGAESIPSQEQAEASQTMAEGITEQADTSAAPEDQQAVTDSVYFIQMTDTTGQVVTSIINPEDISSYTDTIVYKQCMRASGDIETTIVSSGGVPMDQPVPVEQQQPQAEPQQEEQVIYAHDLNGQLTPIPSAQSASDVAPPGKQFVYMQDSSGRIIRTIMDANQTMVPGQQVYYTQSEDGQIITSVMDSAGGTTEPQQSMETMTSAEQTTTTNSVVSGTSGFAIDNSMSGLSMLAELSHLTAEQTPSKVPESRTGTSSSTDSNPQEGDMDEFRPVGMVTQRMGGDDDGEVDAVNSDIAELKVADSEIAGGLKEQGESQVEKIVGEIQQKMGPILPSHSVSKDNLFVQWQNLDAMCWMDVVLIMLVYSPTLRPLVSLDPGHPLSSTLLITLLKANRQAQVLLQNLLKKNSSNSIQTGAGNVGTDPKSSKLVSKENMDEIGKAINILYAMREKIWQALQPRLRCERGKHNSPVLVLPLLVREKPEIKQMFTMKYRYVFKCAKCGYSQDDSHTKILPSIPAVPADFNMQAPSFIRNCFECQAPDQRMLMKFEGLQDFVQMHFVKGLPHSRFEELSFDLNKDHYEVTAVVHYKNNPDHFIAWVRNAPGNTWMECDDLKSVITRYQGLPPNIPPSQVHMVMWERRLTQQHALIMKESDDTRLLASLVLTVQQPTSGASQTQQQPTTNPTPAPATMPTVPATQGRPTTMVSTPNSASTLLSGLMSSSTNLQPTFTPYTPRGRGRGRGSRGRGRGSSTTPNILPPIPRQRAPPGVSTIQMSTHGTTTPQRGLGHRGGTQIVRLPLSALKNASSGISTLGTGPQQATRYVLVGGNNSGQATGSTPGGSAPNKVIMVRSQAGSSQMSATQLLQLLQKSGAISQVAGTGARITTITAPDNQTTSSEQLTTGLPTFTTSSQQMEDVQEPEVPATSGEPGAQIGLQQDYATAPMESEPMEPPTTEVPQPMEQQIESEAPAVSNDSSNPIIVSPPSDASPAVSATSLDQQQPGSMVSTLGGRTTITLNQSGQSSGGARYISIPNPNGSGNILTQLVMKGGKMVLVPVSKSQQQETTTSASVSASPSVIKIPTSQGTGASPVVSIRIPAGQTTLTPTSSAAPSVVKISGGALNTPTSSGPNLRYVTIPSTSGGKRTIQLISVPKGSTSAATGTPQKTIIMGPGGVVHQVSGGSPSGITRLVTTPTSAGPMEDVSTPQPEPLSHISAEGTPVAAAPETSEMAAQTPIVGQDVLGSDSSSTITISPDVTHAAATALASTNTQSTVSLLRGSAGPQVILTSSAGGTPSMLSGATSLLAASPQKPQEGFRYILPGSHVGQTSIIQPSPSTDIGTAKSFTALSSSGTIIGGQLTPAPPPPSAAVEPSLLSQTDQPLIMEGGDQAITSLLGQTPTSVDHRRGSKDGRADGIEYIPLGRGRSRGRGSRGRGRGSRTSRGRGRGQTIMDIGGQVTYTATSLSEAQQLGAHMMETSPVDGVPVVSIPEFQTTDPSAGQSAAEAVSAAASLAAQTASMDQGVPDASPPRLAEDSMDSGPRVITQSLPSVKANHGFDILTQGILASNQSPTVKTGRSLLTGAITSLQTISSPPPSTPPSSTGDLSPLESAASKARQSLCMGQSVTQDEIETLIQAAQAAAKPTKKSGGIGISTLHLEQLDKEDTTPLADFESGAETISKDKEDIEAELRDRRVVSVDESSVSVAERYRMPSELFEPDEESPEKPVRSDGIKAGDGLPAALFNESDGSIITSPTTQKVENHQDTTEGEPMEVGSEEKLDVETADVDDSDRTASTPVLQPTGNKTPKKSSGKKSKRGGGKRKGSGKRKSKSVSISEGSEEVLKPMSPAKAQSSVSVGGFATDLLQEEEQTKPTKLEESHADKEESSELVDIEEPEPMEINKSTEPEVLPVKKDQVSELVDKVDSIEGKPLVPARKAEEKFAVYEHKAVEKHVLPRRRRVCVPAVVVNKKEKASWAKVDEESDDEDKWYPPSPFNYSVLVGKQRKSSVRHPTLGPKEKSFTSPPLPLPDLAPKSERMVEKGDKTMATVTRQSQCAASPKNKDWTIQPVTEEGDAAVVGGCRVRRGDVVCYTPVLVRRRAEESVDWTLKPPASATEEEYKDESSGDMDDKDMSRTYCIQLFTALMIEAGDFSSLLENLDTETEEEQVETQSEQRTSEEVSKQPEQEEDSVPAQTTSKPEETKSKPSKRKRSSVDPEEFPAEKRPCSSSEGGPSSPTPDSQSSADDGITSPVSQVNGVDKLGSPVSSPSHPGSDYSAILPKGVTSPSRRSGRSHIPSKKVLDAIEDSPPLARSRGKGGRKSSLLTASDDDAPDQKVTPL